MTPGLFGTMQIKWLARLRFETAESANFYHATEYRVPYRLLQPGEKFKFTLENSRPTWDIKLMSYVLVPQPGAKLEAGPVTISGVAYNDGKARHRNGPGVDRQGKSWESAELEVPESPYAWYSGRPSGHSRAATTRSGRGPSTISVAANRSTARSSGTRTATSGPGCSRFR